MSFVQSVDASLLVVHDLLSFLEGVEGEGYLDQIVPTVLPTFGHDQFAIALAYRDEKFFFRFHSSISELWVRNLTHNSKIDPCSMSNFHNPCSPNASRFATVAARPRAGVRVAS